MTNLSTRAEQAKPEETRGLLEELFVVLNGERPCSVGQDLHHWLIRYQPFGRKLNAEAYLDASMMLVPEGWSWLVRSKDDKEAGHYARIASPDFESVTWGKGECWITNIVSGSEQKARAATPALALIAAIARSLGQ